jgi:hypothetical protein
MSSATDIASPIVTGVIIQKHSDAIVIAIPHSDYRVLLLVKPDALAKLPSPPHGPLTPHPVGLASPAELNVSGKITAKAKRVDVLRSGGRFLDPTYGRPRRVQGRVVHCDVKANTITVFCGIPITATIMQGQTAADFPVGTAVAFDVERGARFEPVDAHAHH